MNKLMFLILLLIITLVSCDGRDRKHKSNAQVLKEAKLFESFSEETKLIPNSPVQIITDTILSNGFHVKLKYHSIENDFISKTIKAKNDSSIIKKYKNFEAQFQVLKHEKIISEQIINKEFFNKFESSLFWSNAIMQFIWIDYNTSTKNRINLNTSFCVPETDTCKDFTIGIDEFGNIEIEEINLVPNII